jgi:hypothetical protein
MTYGDAIRASYALGLDREDILLRRKLNIVFGTAFDDPKTHVGEHPTTPT